MHKKWTLVALLVVACGDPTHPVKDQAMRQLASSPAHELELTQEEIESLPEYIPEYPWANAPTMNSEGSRAYWGTGADRAILHGEPKGQFSNAHAAWARPYLIYKRGGDYGQRQFLGKSVWQIAKAQGWQEGQSGNWQYGETVTYDVGSLCNTTGELRVNWIGTSLFRIWREDLNPPRYAIYEALDQGGKVHTAGPQGTNCSTTEEGPYPTSGPCDEPGTSLIEECVEPYDHTTETRENWKNSPWNGYVGYYYCPTTVYYVTTIYGTFPTGQTWTGNCSWNLNVARMSSVLGPPTPDPRLRRIAVSIGRRMDVGDIATVTVSPSGSVYIGLAATSARVEVLSRAFDIVPEGISYIQRRGSRGLKYHMSDLPRRSTFGEEREWIEQILSLARFSETVYVDLNERPRY